MADFGQNDEVVSKPSSTAASKSSWGHDDDVVSTKPAPVESKGGAAFGVYSRPGMEPNRPTPTTSALGAFGASAAEAVAATPGVLAGARVGSSMMPPVAPVVGPLSKPIGGIVGGIAGGILANAGIKSLEQFADMVFGTDIVGTREAQQREQPIASLAGQVAGGGLNPFMRPGLPSSLKQAAAGGGIMGVVGATQRAVEGADPFDPTSMAVDVGMGAFTKPTKLGERMLGHTATPTKPTTEKTTTETVDKGTTQEEKDAFLKVVKAKTPLVEAAIRNKETGEVTRLGPKHPEDVKESTKDTHEQGFVDEAGQFLERKDAWNRAVDTGQIDKTAKPTVMGEGLHSGDLRAAGDERFQITEDQREGVPSNKRPVTLDDTTPPKFVYHGTNTEPQIDAQGNLVLNPSENFSGKTSSISLTHNPDVAVDYAARIKGGGPGAFDFNNAKTVKIHSDALPEGISRESGEEWAYNTDQLIVIPKGKFEVVDHPLSQDSTPESRQAEANRLEDIVDQRGKGTYQEPSVEWNKPKETPSSSGEPVKETVTTEPKEDITKTSPRDVESLDHFFEVATEIYKKSGEKAALEFFEGYREYQKTWPNFVAEVEKFVGTNLKSKDANERIISNNKADLLELAGKDVDLEKITYDIDKGNKLEGAAKKVADKFRQLMDTLGKKALENGVINGWHEDYVARNVISEGNAPKGALEEFMQEIFGSGERTSEGGTKTTTKYGEPRRLKTREDLLIHLNAINEWLAANGKDYRFKLKTDNLAEIYADYAHSVEKAIENKNLITNIKQIRNINGESLIRPITPEQPKPHGWIEMNTAELAGYAIHPDLVPSLKFVFDSGPNMLMQAAGQISQVTKRLNVIGSFFHAKSLMEVQSSAGIPLWTPIKESIVLPLVEKGVKAVTGKDLQLSAVSKAVEQFRRGGVGDNVDKWIRESGLKLESPEDVSRGVLSATGKFADDMIAKFGPKTRVLEKTLSTVEKYTLSMFDKYTWDYLHTGSKLMVADAYLDKARMQAAKEGKPFNEAEQRKQIAQFVNDSFGGLNWFDAATSAQTELGKRMAMAAYSPEGRRGLQVMLFAPDWTISTVRAFTSALPKGLNPTKWHPVEGIKGMMNPTTKADYARLYQFKTALTYLTLVNAINMMTANRPIWENKDPTRIEWPDGTSMQAMKHAMEPYHWLADPDKTFASKLGFIPKAIWVGLAGTEYASPQAQKIVPSNITGNAPVDEYLSRAKVIGESTLPFQVQAAAGAPEGEGVKRALLGTAGFPVYGSTAEQKKLKRAERELATKENAWRYRDKEIQAGRMPMTSKHREEERTLRRRREVLDKKVNKE